MASKRPQLQPQNNSLKRPLISGRRKASADLFADLHESRKRLAERFGYNDARLIEYVYSLPIPSWIRVIDIPSNKKRLTSKSA